MTAENHLMLIPLRSFRSAYYGPQVTRGHTDIERGREREQTRAVRSNQQIHKTEFIIRKSAQSRESAAILQWDSREISSRKQSERG